MPRPTRGPWFRPPGLGCGKTTGRWKTLGDVGFLGFNDVEWEFHGFLGKNWRIEFRSGQLGIKLPKWMVLKGAQDAQCTLQAGVPKANLPHVVSEFQIRLKKVKLPSQSWMMKNLPRKHPVSCERQMFPVLYVRINQVIYAIYATKSPRRKITCLAGNRSGWSRHLWSKDWETNVHCLISVACHVFAAHGACCSAVPLFQIHGGYIRLVLPWQVSFRSVSERYISIIMHNQIWIWNMVQPTRPIRTNISKVKQSICPHLSLVCLSCECFERLVFQSSNKWQNLREPEPCHGFQGPEDMTESKQRVGALSAMTRLWSLQGAIVDTKLESEV